MVDEKDGPFEAKEESLDNEFFAEEDGYGESDKSSRDDSGEDLFEEVAGEGPAATALPEASEDESTGKKKRRTYLLVLLLLAIAGYGLYAYIIPQYFPDLPSSPSAEKAAAIKVPVPERVAVKAPPKPAVTPQKTGGVKIETAKTAEEKVAEPIKVEAATADVLGPAKRETAVAEPKVEASAAPKKAEVIKAKLPAAGGKGYFVQAGAFIFKDNLAAVKKKVEAAGYRPRVETGYRPIRMNRLTAGSWRAIEEAKSAALELREQGYNDAKVVTVDRESFSVLIGSYYYQNVAIEEKALLEVKGYKAEIVKKPVKMRVYNLLLGPYKTVEEAAKVDTALKGQALETVILEKR